LNAGIVGSAESESYQRQRVRTDLLGDGNVWRRPWPVFDRDEPALRRRGVGYLNGCNPHVVAADTGLLCELRSRDVDAGLDAVVPRICRLTEVFRNGGLLRLFGQVGRNEQRGDLDSYRKWGQPRILFPAILFGGGSVPDDEGDGSSDHRPEAAPFVERQMS